MADDISPTIIPRSAPDAAAPPTGEGTLRSERDFLASLLETLQDGLAVSNADGELIRVNDRLCRMTGFREAELIGAREPYPYWPPETAGAIRATVASIVASGGNGEFDLELVRSTGERFPAIVTTSALRDRHGKVTGRVTSIKDVSARRQAEREREALRRAALVVAGVPAPEEVFAAVARETAGFVRADAALVVRFEEEGQGVVVGTHGDHSSLGERLPTRGSGALAKVARWGRPAIIADYAALEPGSPLREHALAAGYKASAAAPVRVQGGLWGAVLVTTRRDEGLPDGTANRLGRFAELVGLAVANAAAREELRRLAATDTLTRLHNRRAFEERLVQEVERARRHTRELSLVVVDIDHFKRVNDAHGHPAGDQVLIDFAACLRRFARMEDTLARMGGEEFAWLMPEANSQEAAAAAERLRDEVAHEPFPHGIAITVSAGVCSLSDAGGATELYRLADEALYHAKSAGRDRVCRYTLQMSELTARVAEVGRSSARLQAVRGVRALARAVDAKDPATRLHSERVADLAVRLALTLAWPPEQVIALSEAALVHDVGKIGVPDAILLKPDRLTAEEYEQVKQHAELGARIAADVLTEEQVSWVRHHHERWDGAGYPAGIAGAAIPRGALIIAVVDALDVMLTDRVYAPAKTFEKAMEELRRGSGGQFAPWAVTGFERLVRNDAQLIGYLSESSTGLRRPSWWAAGVPGD
ncbi:MAG: diguanylate cyclase [Actinomycetota bacterium]